MSNNLGLNVFVTGANRGIGFALIKALSQFEGIRNIFAGCRNPIEAKDLLSLSQAHQNIKIVKIDIQDDASIDSAYHEVFKILENEGLNLLINNSGIFEKEGGAYDSPQRDVLQNTFNTNASGVAMVTFKFLPLVQKAAEQGHRAVVANISSTGGSIERAHRLPFNNIIYGMSKAALNHYTKTMSLYFKEAGVIFVSFCPGWVKTDMGGPNAMLAPEDSAKALLKSISGLSIEDTGKFLNRLGESIPY